jgi:hypothetical protein
MEDARRLIEDLHERNHMVLLASSAKQQELTAAVERFSGREVLVFLSANHVDPDYAVETFLLTPRVRGDGVVSSTNVGTG